MTSEGWGEQGMWYMDIHNPLSAHRLGHLGSDGALEALQGLQAVSVAHAADCQGLCHDSCPLLGALGCHRQLQVAGGSRGLAGQRGGCIGKAVPQICGDLHVGVLCQKCSPGNHLALGLDSRHQQAPYSNSNAGTIRPHAPDIDVIMHKNGSSTVDTLMTWLTWSRLGSVQVGESVVGWAGGPSARRRRLCRLELRLPSSTCRNMHTCSLQR